MDEETKTIVVKQKSPIVDTKTLIVGGGLVGVILYLLFFRGGKGPGQGGYYTDKVPVTFRLRSDGLYLGNAKTDVTAAINRVFQGKRNDMVLQTAGDVPQGIYQTFVDAFTNAGIKVLQPQPQQTVASMYRRGLGGNVA